MGATAADDAEKNRGARHLRFVRSGPLAIAASAWGAEYEITIVIPRAGADGAPPPAASDFDMVGTLAVVNISDPLVHHKHWRWDSYDEILRRAACAFASECSEVVLRINSPGGDVDGCFDAARSLRAMALASKKPLTAYVDGMAASAAYALACAASRIVVSSTSTVGSIGIVEAIRSQVAADEKQGEEYVFVTSGEHKSDGNPHVPITAKAVANLKSQVDGMASLFFELVEELRGLPAAKSEALQARVYFGANGVREGLADEVLTWSALTGGKQQSSGANQGTTPMAKASYLRHMLKSLAESDDENVSEGERKHAKKMLKMLEDGAPDEGAPPEKKDDKSDAKKAEDEGEGEGKKAEGEDEGEGEGKKGKKAEGKKAEGEDEGEGKHAKKAEGEGEDESKKAKATASMAARLQALEATNAAREIAQRRQALMASRPDLADEVRAWLDSEPIETVERALKTLPKGSARGLGRAAAASNVGGTRGERQNDDGQYASVEPELERHIARKMGGAEEGTGIRRQGRSVEFGFMTPAQAKAFLTKRGLAADTAANAAGKDK